MTKDDPNELVDVEFDLPAELVQELQAAADAAGIPLKMFAGQMAMLGQRRIGQAVASYLAGHASGEDKRLLRMWARRLGVSVKRFCAVQESARAAAFSETH